MADDELRLRLAELVVEALEVGGGKQEWDVVDEIFEAFGVVYADLDAGVAQQVKDRARVLRELAGRRLAEAAPSAVDLLNVVVRCGGRFVDMLNAVYARLARHVATTRGSSETFRIERQGVDEEALTISPAFLEEIRQLIETLRSIPVGRVDERAVRDFLVVDNGAFYGSWPPSDRSDDKRFAAVLLGLPYVGASVEERATGDPAWAQVIPVWQTAHAAADRLIATAEDLLRSHMAHLELLADDDTETAAAEAYLTMSSGQLVLAEIELFRTAGVLTSGVSRDAVPGVDGDGGLGLRSDGTTALVPVSYWTGSGIGALASFVAMWRLGLWPRHPRELVVRQLDAGPRGVAKWLEWIASACEEATDWLAEDVLDVTRTIDARDQIEALTQFLNLPLWRQRELLYEVWVLCATLDACEAADWSVDLVGLTRTDNVWTLSVGQTQEPTARLTSTAYDDTGLDVWREPARWTADGLLTPDVTVSTPAPYVRDLLVVEAKDRQKMTPGRSGASPAPGPRTALGVAERYAAGLRPNATWVCNHCDFRQAVDPGTNHGNAWTRVHLADRFRPGNVPAAFGTSVRAALNLPPVEASGSRASGLVLVADMTSSMGSWLDSCLAELELTGDAFEAHRAVLYSDHGSGEPFLVHKLGPYDGIDELISAVRAQPGGKGGDREEALEDAMQRCGELVADIGPQTILVLTDAPPHSVADCPYRIDFHAEVGALLRAGCRLHIATDELDPADEPWPALNGLPGVAFAPLTELTATWSAGAAVPGSGSSR